MVEFSTLILKIKDPRLNRPTIFIAFRVHKKDDMKISYHCNPCDKEFTDKEMAMDQSIHWS